MAKRVRLLIDPNGVVFDRPGRSAAEPWGDGSREYLSPNGALFPRRSTARFSYHRTTCLARLMAHIRQHPVPSTSISASVLTPLQGYVRFHTIGNPGFHPGLSNDARTGLRLGTAVVALLIIALAGPLSFAEDGPEALRRRLQQRQAALREDQRRLEAQLVLQDQRREEALKRGNVADFDRLRDPFASELQFMTKVGELSAEQIAELKRAGEQALERRSVQIASGAARRRVRQVVVMVNGKPVVHDEWSELPQVLVRRELTLVLKAISHDAWEKFDAQRERLDERRKRADVLVQVAAFDEALLLTHDEREHFRNLLSQRWTDVWRGHLDENAAANLAQLCLTAIGAMDLFSIPRVELESVLRPSQLAAFDFVQLPTRLEAVFVEQSPPQDQVAPNQGVAGNNAAAGLERLRFGAGKIVRHGVPLSEERQRLESLLQRLIEDAQIHAALDEEQRQKLLLAGKLDLGRYFDEQTALYEKPPGGRAFVVPQEQIAGAKVRLPPVLSSADSVFQKTLRRRLSPQQAAKLADAQRERDRFHRQAVLEALTVGLSQSASLTDEQAERVQLVLAERLNNAEETGDVVERRRTTLRQLAELRPDEIKPLVDDWQWPAAREYLIELAATARSLDAQQGLPREPEEEALLGIPAAP